MALKRTTAMDPIASTVIGLGLVAMVRVIG